MIYLKSTAGKKKEHQSATGWLDMVKNMMAGCLAIYLFFIFPGYVDQAHAKEALPVLEAAESLFKAMKAAEYPKIWNLLTLKSRENILDDVYKAMSKEGASISRDDLHADFASGGSYATAYWGAYLNVFDPDAVLEHSKWDIGIIKKDRAEIVIHHRKSERPARLLLYREQNLWKVGLEETFRPRRWLNP